METNKTTYKNFGFSFAEIFIFLVIVSVIASFIVGIVKSKKDFEIKKQYYFASKNLNDAVFSIKSNGYLADGNTQKTYSMPTDGRKFCNLISDIFNSVGTKNCSEASNAPESRNFKTATPSFVLTNGVKIFNAASAPLSIKVADVSDERNANDNAAFKTACDLLGCSTFDYNNEMSKWNSWASEITYSQGANRPENPIQVQYQQTVNSNYAGAVSEAKSDSIIFKRLANSINSKKYSSLISTLNDYTPPVAQTGIPANAVTDLYTKVDSIIYKIKNAYAELNSGTTILYYDIFVDVNGDKGNGRIDEDVFEFYITEAGYVYPKPDTFAPNKASFISAQIKTGDDVNPQKFSYLEALCRSGYVENAMFRTICSANSFHNTDYTVDTAIGCDKNKNLNKCTIKLLPPGY